MLPSDMVAEIQAHDFQDIAAARIYPLLTMENRRVCSMAPFPFLEKFSTWTESVGTAGAPLTGAPTDVRAVLNMGLPAYANSSNLAYLKRALIEKYYGTNSYLLTDDYPRHYNVYGKNSTGGGNLYIYPYIKVATIILLDYIALPPVLGAGTTEAQMLLPDEYCPIIMDRVLARLSRGEGDLTDGETYDNRAREGVQDLMNAFDVNLDSPDPMIATTDDYYDF